MTSHKTTPSPKIAINATSAATRPSKQVRFDRLAGDEPFTLSVELK